MSRLVKIRLLLLLAILLVFGQIVNHDFVDWDDGALIYNNPNFAHPTLRSLSHHWNPSNRDNLSMFDPVVFTFWWVLAHWAHVNSPDVLGATLNPYLFHAANLLVHWLNACLVFEILRRLRIGDWAAAIGALVFAIHPMQTEPVAWATGMKDLLSGMFALLTIWRYIVALQSQGKSRTRNYWLASGFFVLALLSKPSTVVVPIMAGAIDRVIYRRAWRDIAKWLSPWFAASIAFTIIASRVQAMEPNVGGPPWARPLIALYALAFYLGKLVLPIGTRMDYGHNPQILLADPDHYYLLYWVWIFPVILGLIIWRSRKQILITAGLIFLAGVLPVLGLVPFAYEYYTVVADRYVYPSMLGVALAVGWLLDRYGIRWVNIAAVGVIVVFGGLSFVSASHWVDTDHLYSYTLNGTHAIHYLIVGDYQADLAKPYYRRAEEAFAAQNFVLAHDLQAQGNAYVEHAIDDYRTAIKMEPIQTQSYDRLAKILVQFNRFSEAIEVINQWKLVEPNVEAAAQEPPGQLDGMLGELYLRNGQFPQSIDALKRSVAENPGLGYDRILQMAEKLQAQAATRPTTR